VLFLMVLGRVFKQLIYRLCMYRRKTPLFVATQYAAVHLG
jgi:hypothetical protein